MPTCRDIRPEVWTHVRQALVFYFSRRYRVLNAEDLAQETLMAILSREDYEFEKEEDFLRVCYGFANHVLQHNRRQQQRSMTEALPAVGGGIRPCRAHLEPAELRVLLDEVLTIGRTQLSDNDWNLIQEAVTTSPGAMKGVENASIANKIRVRLSRARTRLAKATGWRDI